jgi:TetR/AcrR family transcriptional regulator, transcriptional repressor for nem operon
MSNKRLELERVASDLVHRSGMSELSFRTLAEHVGVKSSSVHYYFPEKNDLIVALIKNYTEGFIDQLHDTSSRDVTLKEKLMAFIGIFESATADHKLCLCGMLAAEVSSLDGRSRLLLGAFFKLGERWLSTVFKQHIDELVVTIKPESLAMAVMSGLEGAILLDRVLKDQRHLRSQKQLVTSLIH